jgi:2-oxoglutarate ferredoxin oxidoreductase subunit alpha
MTFQAEDEIAAITSAIGASMAGSMAVTISSGPGIALKGEAMGLAVMTELPLIIINVQRGGPSTGLPTKTEQADLFQALYGRNGECPIPVLAAQSPADCFDIAQQAWRIATRYMTPVMVLSDGYLANGSEPWRIPEIESLPPIPVEHPKPRHNGHEFMPYARDKRFARPWALPGTPGLMHRIGGLEKHNITGAVSYVPANHQQMIDLRARKVEGVVDDIPNQTVLGPEQGELLVLSWGGTYGACTTAVRRAHEQGQSVAHAHLRYLNPMPANLGGILSRYKQVLIPELNRGQLRTLVRQNYLVDALGLNKIQGRPLSATEVLERIQQIL